MNEMEAMRCRHSVRKYTVAPINSGAEMALRSEVDVCNEQGCLGIQLITDDSSPFAGGLAHYGGFENVRNYFVIAGPDNLPDLDERCGYYGERLVLLAQRLGLNTCWCALTYKKRKVRPLLKEGERLVAIIAVGVGMNDGYERESKLPEQVSKDRDKAPLWFRYGLEAALMAPTAFNKQRFCIEWTDIKGDQGKYLIRLRTSSGPQEKVCKGIVKYHFEAAVGEAPFVWV